MLFTPALHSAMEGGATILTEDDLFGSVTDTRRLLAVLATPPPPTALLLLHLQLLCAVHDVVVVVQVEPHVTDLGGQPRLKSAHISE